jgi:hypothetical protein
MNTELQDLLDDLQRTPPAKLIGAVKTHPLRELLKGEKLIQARLLRKDLSPQQAQALKTAYNQVQHIITKRIDTAQQLIEKFAEATPEIIAFNNSVFALVPSRDLLEDIKVAFQNSPKQLSELTKASANIFEAVNIEIQQKFYELTPETIAVHYSGPELNAYRKLLKNLLAHIDVDSEIFKIYNTLTRNVVEGTKIHKTQIGVVKALCNKVFQTVPPSYETVLDQLTTEELDSYQQTLQASLNILERDITGRPSVVELTNQCRQLLTAIPKHIAERKVQMRKTTRVLQLSHYIEFLSPEKISENATTTLILCQILFEDIRRFLLTQQTHLDVMLNIRSLEDAQRKIEEGLQYRQYAIGQLFKEIATLSSEELSAVSENRLGASTGLLQEIQNLTEDLIRRSPSAPSTHIQKFAESLGENINKLQEAIVMSKKLPANSTYQPLEFEYTLPNLSKFYDEKLMELIRKALRTDGTPVDAETDSSLNNVFIIPIERLWGYIESFIRATKTTRTV